MSIPFTNPLEVFIFIILCSIYVCSILWIYGDSATRDVGVKGAILPLVFVAAGALALAKGMMLALLVWPTGYIAWFVVRPKRSHVIAE